MIKKNTLIVLLIAVLLGGGVYFYNQKHGQKESSTNAESKPAFDVKNGDIVAMTLTHPAKPDTPAIQLKKENGTWQILAPVETGADQPSVEGITSGLAAALFSGTEPGTPDRLKAYGLDPAQISIEFQTKNGGKHTLLLGNKDFTGEYVYGVADGGKKVDLLPQTMLVSADKSLEDLRNRDVLRIESEDVASFDLKNATGEISAKKGDKGWMLTKPEEKPADAENVSSLLAEVSTSKMQSIVSEKPENLGKYGLTSPSITFVTKDDKGNEQSLLIGKKDGDTYFARDLSRPMIFRINNDLYLKLAENFGSLRDKTVLRFSQDDVDRAEVKNTYGDVTIYRKTPGKAEWLFAEPDSEKGKQAGSWKFFSPLETARADDVLDHPPAEALAALRKPPITATLTTKDGKKITVDISKPDKGFVYVKTSETPSVFKVKSDFYDGMNFTAAQAIF
ncbi:MAG TPA: DUF4340 domain-containing protein [Candidatus Acidoferrum sp.]|nr:DUF4340 domain-containing protein [Candidatus Acidoferrum sp.]